MANTQQTLNKIRSHIRRTIGKDVEIEESFFTFDYDSQRIVINRKIDGWHFIYDLEGNEIKSHKD